MEHLSKGFDLNRNVHDIIDMVKELFNEDGTPKQNLSSDRRKGITGLSSETGILDIHNNLPIMHAYIHVLKHMEHIGYTFNARWAFEDPENPKQGMGSKKDEVEKWAVKTSKDEFRKNAYDKDGLNLPLDCTDIFDPDTIEILRNSFCKLTAKFSLLQANFFFFFLI